MGRQKKGQDTWKRLRDWHDGQTPAERLSSRLLNLIGYSSVDPSHPLGGPDGGKDVICKKDGKKWVVGVYFPNGQKEFKEIEKKFDDDLKGVSKNDADGFVFITNQELKISEKKTLEKKEEFDIELIHLEALASIMDTPIGFALRMEFLDIEMNKEEQLSYMVSMHDRLNEKGEELTKLKIENNQLRSVLESKEGQDEKKETVLPYYATAKKMGSAYDYINVSGSVSLSNEFVHKCSSCGFGFYVSKSNFDPIRGTVFSPTIGSYFTDKHAVECPKCGNVDNV